MRLCLDCGQAKELTDFPPAARRSDGRGSYCKVCMLSRSKMSYRKRQAEEGRQVRDWSAPAADEKYCNDCNTVKATADFPKNRNGAKGFGSYCKPCHNARGAATLARVGGSRHYRLVSRYGITAAEADAMVESQGGLCAVCRERPPVHVDHDHTFGNVRGILCFTCNGGLGQFRDRADILHNAIDYLERTTWQRTLVRPGVYRLTSPRQGAARSATSSA